MATERLTLSSGDSRDYVTIDGEKYPLADMGDFTIAQANALRRKGKELLALQGKDELTDEEAARADDAVAEVFHAVVPGIPKSVSDRLTTGKKGQVIEAFFQAAAAKRSAAAPSGTTATPPPSPASSASTAATPSAG